VDRREFHPGAPRLDGFLSDPQAFIGGQVGTRPIALDGPWGDAERLWDRFLSGGTRAPGFRLVRVGSKLSHRDYCRPAPIGNEQLNDVVEPNRVLEHYAAGATVVLQALQFTDTAYAELSTNLALELDHPVQVNAYLTPPVERGLDIHFDYHDVIVVQLVGSKRWRIWRPLQRSERPVKRGKAITQPSPAELGTPVLDHVLRGGECLAVPRGFPHAAESTDAESAHLTIGIMALTWNRVLRDVIDEVASGSALADRVAFGGLGGFVGADSLSPTEALSALTDNVTADRLRHAIATEVWRRQPRTRLRLRRSVTVGAEQPLTISPGPLLWLDCRPSADGKHALQLGDRRLRFPAECSPFVAGILRAAAPFTGATLGGDLDTPSRVAVLSRLATEGVVRA
jgi:hypothetical protein